MDNTVPSTSGENETPMKDLVDLSLRDVIESGDTKSLQRLIFSGCDLNATLTGQGYTPCILATLSSSIPALQLLHRAGADMLSVDNAGCTSFHHAASMGERELLDFLIHVGAECDKGNKDGDTPLMLAASKGLHNIVLFLLAEHRSDKNAVNNNRQTALHKAVLAESVETVQILKNYEATVDRRDESVGETPLMYACRKGTQQIVKLLLEAGADILKVNKQGESALFIAAQGGHAEVVTLLLGREPQSSDDLDSGATGAFCAAASNGHANIVRLLINAGKAYEAKSAFQTAARLGHADVIKAMLGHLSSLIVQESNDLMVLNELFQQSLLAAVEGCHLQVMDVLLKTKVSITIRAFKKNDNMGQLNSIKYR